MEKIRYLHKPIAEDILKKMVFIGGPRQVGKTTLSKMIASNVKNSKYFNWDSRSHRLDINSENWPPETKFIIFDELHKYAKWKSFIKGVWDTKDSPLKIIVTGSSKLNVFRKGGDSLLGRYHYYTLHPFSLKEIDFADKKIPEYSDSPPELIFNKKGKSVKDLLKFGGFPEPFLSGSERTLQRWHQERFERIMREDIRDYERIHSLSQIEILAEIIPSKVGSPLSINSLINDLQASHKTIKSWLEILSRNYYIFSVSPYSKKISRAIKKEKKYYLWDWSEIKDEGMKYENMIAVHLLKYCNYFQEAHGKKVNLHYLRDRDKREVDFVITWDENPWIFVECKYSYKSTHRPLKYFAERFNVSNRFIVTASERHDFVDKRNKIRVIPASKFLASLI